MPGLRSWKILAGLAVATVLVLYLSLSVVRLPEQIHIPFLQDKEVFHWKPSTTAFQALDDDDAFRVPLDQICRHFPKHKLDRIQPVLKSGHGVANRVRQSLRGTSACLDNLFIFSDLDEVIEGRHVVDVIAEIPHYLLSQEAAANQTSAYFDMIAMAANGSLDSMAHASKAGWKTDKFKFVASATMAWQLAPEREWYVFFEGDTYVVWDTVFRLLDHFHPDEPHYFGSPSPGRENVWFANGGPGYILSREAMWRLMAHDWDQSGLWLGNVLLQETWDDVLADCCGDSILGWALHTREVELDGLWPLFNPHPLHGIPFSDLYWCQPVLSLHKSDSDQAAEFWRWEWEARARHPERPVQYRDVATSFFDVASFEPRRQNWDNGGWDTYAPNDDDPYLPHDSVDACAYACEMATACLQWTYHLRRCWFVRSIRVGIAREPESADEHEGEEWSEEDLTFVAGWDTAKIGQWIEERPCESVLWVKPSTERVF